MRKLLALAVLFTLGMASTVFADAITTTVGRDTLARKTRTVFNDSGGALTSGTVVVWDNDGAGFEFDRSGFPYVTTTTTVDFIWVAGVTLPDSCADQSLCEIVTEGPVITRVAMSTDVAVEDNLVGTTSVAGEAGAYTTGNNLCALGISMELREAFTGVTVGLTASDNAPMWVFVRITCDD